MEFVRTTTDASSPQFVSTEKRIATFDQDGTLWVEKPTVPQLTYCLDRVSALAEKKPELKNVEPFKTVLSGDQAAVAQLTMSDLKKILVATLTGITTDQYRAEVKQWLAMAKDPRWKKPYNELTYQPMQEVLKYLRANGYRTYIVSGVTDRRTRQRRESPRSNPALVRGDEGEAEGLRHASEEQGAR
ncbi:MAG: haloacid dehalogenase-like hydrolase, partial [Thermoguttaceae bacterium]